VHELPATATIGGMSRPRTAKSPPTPMPEVMTIDDLAGYLQVSKSSLYKLVQSGKVPGQKVGKHWRFSRAVIERWLARSEHPTTARQY